MPNYSNTVINGSVEKAVTKAGVYGNIDPYYDEGYEYGILFQKVVASFVFDIKYGPWLAGGSVRRLIEYQAFNDWDFDIWFLDQVQYNEFLKNLTDNFETKVVCQTKNGLTIKAKLEDDVWITLQLIHRKFYTSPEFVINSFDMTCCQCLTDGVSLLTGQTTLNDINHGDIVINDDSTPMTTWNVGSLKRICKFIQEGYSITDEEILRFYQRIKERTDAQLMEESPSDHYKDKGIPF